MSLLDWGWSDFFSRYALDGLEPGRVIAVHREQVEIVTERGELRTELSGRLLYASESPADLPAAGDWVLLRQGIVDRVLPRRTVLSRKAAGNRGEEQVLAANIDVLFVVSGLDLDFNPRRLERYMVLAIESRAQPVLVLNKSDLCEDRQRVLVELGPIAERCPVLWMSAAREEGTGAIEARLPRGTTGALIGSSGAGKSTLVNALIRTAVQATRTVRDDDSRGRHTTTHRQLFRLQGGGLLLDQPGLREIQLLAGTQSVAASFPEIRELAEQCRFRDCKHRGEPGCAVDGLVDRDRLASYHKLLREVEKVAEQGDAALRLRRQQALKAIHKRMRHNDNRTGR